jgi:hypothetical protein
MSFSTGNKRNSSGVPITNSFLGTKRLSSGFETPLVSKQQKGPNYMEQDYDREYVPSVLGSRQRDPYMDGINMGRNIRPRGGKSRRVRRSRKSAKRSAKKCRKTMTRGRRHH